MVATVDEMVASFLGVLWSGDFVDGATAETGASAAEVDATGHDAGATVYNADAT